MQFYTSSFAVEKLRLRENTLGIVEKKQKISCLRKIHCDRRNYGSNLCCSSCDELLSTWKRSSHDSAIFMAIKSALLELSYFMIIAAELKSFCFQTLEKIKICINYIILWIPLHKGAGERHNSKWTWLKGYVGRRPIWLGNLNKGNLPKIYCTLKTNLYARKLSTVFPLALAKCQPDFGFIN